MDFDFTDEQRLLKDSIDRLMADRYSFEARKTYAASPAGWSADMWQLYAGLGLLGLPFSEAHGGFGGGPVETMIVMEAMGGSLALEPWLSSVVIGGGLLRHSGSGAQQVAILPLLASGVKKLALAQMERHSRHDLANVTTQARRTGSGFVIDGEKSLVLHGDSADVFIVVARTSGAATDRVGIGLFLVDARAKGVTVRSYPTQDGGRAAEVAFSGVDIDEDAVLGDPAHGLPVLERVIDEAIAALCAEAVGAMAAMHRLTVDYLKLRKQFGVAIGSFQVLQHRAADMFVALEQARSMALLATMMIDEPEARPRRAAMQAAKIQICRSGKFIAQQAVQLHGGVGVTMEYAIGHYFKRLTMIDSQFGDADHHLGLLAQGGVGILD